MGRVCDLMAGTVVVGEKGNGVSLPSPLPIKDGEMLYNTQLSCVLMMLVL